MSEFLSSEDLDSQEMGAGEHYHRISYEIFRRAWFETGGTDLWGDATDEELGAAKFAHEESTDYQIED